MLGTDAAQTAALSGAPRGNKNALKSGLYTGEAIAERKAVRDLLRESRKMMMRLVPTTE